MPRADLSRGSKVSPQNCLLNHYSVHDLRAFAKRAGHQIVGVFKETASGAKNDRVERMKVMALPRPGRSTPSLSPSCRAGDEAPQDLVQTLDDLHSWMTSGPPIRRPSGC